jgi:peroxiredoxin
MKRATLFMAGLLLARAASAADVGDKVGEFRLADVHGVSHALSEYSGKIVVLTFWSFKCPVALGYTERIQALREKYSARGVMLLGVASNLNEAPAELQRNAANLGLAIPMLIDSEGTLAEALGATHTPSAFILDRGGVVRYQGALDNNKRPGDRARIAHVEEALDALLAGQSVQVRETAPFGCGIRRRGGP